MQGFPNKGQRAQMPANAKLGFHPQRLAGGGIVDRIKQMAGITPADPVRAAQLAEYRAQAAQEKAATQQAAPAPAPAPALTDYSGMGAMQRREKALGLKDGGMIRGPGTGTSDSIPDEMAPGTYILPADTTKKLALDDKKVPVRVSNGEYELPPEQVQAVGAAVLDAIKGVTHAPKSLSARGLQSPQDEQFFATGGSVRDPEELRKMIPQVEAMGYAQSPAAAPAPGASASQSLAQRVSQIPTGGQTAPAADGSQNSWANTETGRNLSNIASALPGSLGGAIPAVAKTGGAISGGIDAATRLLNAGVGAAAISAIPGAAPAQGATPSTIASPPTSQTNPAAAPASTSLANAGRGVVNPPTINPSAPAPSNAPAAAPEVMPGVYRHGRGQYSDNASGMGMPANFTGQPSAQNMAAGESLAARSQQASMGRALSQPAGFQPQGVTAPTVRRLTSHELRNLEVSASSIMNREKWGGKGAQENPSVLAYKAALANDAAAQAGQVTLDGEAMRQTGGIQREGMQQDGATTRTGIQEQGANAREAGRNALTAEELGLKREAQGFQTRAATQKEQLRNTLIDPKATPEQRKQAQEYLQALAVSDKEPSPQYKSYVMPAIRNADGSTTEGGVYQENTRTGEGRWVKPQGDGQAQLPPGMTRQVGTSNGRPVYEDAKGNRFGG